MGTGMMAACGAEGEGRGGSLGQTDIIKTRGGT